MLRISAVQVVIVAVAGLLCVKLGASGEMETVTLPEMRVVGTKIEAETEEVLLEELSSGRYANLGEALIRLPGISGVRRAQGIVEPVIRGLGWERVQTQVDGLPLYGACPGRMDPPVNNLQPETVQAAHAVGSLPSVTLGPAGTGGRIMVSTDYEQSPGARPELNGSVRSAYDSGRNGVLGGLATYGGSGRLDFFGSFAGTSLGDYESADGTSVPAQQNQLGGSVSLGYRPLQGHRGRFGFIDLEDRGIDYPSLPMDSERTSSRIFTLGYRVNKTLGALEEIRLRTGYGMIDHVMSNREKPNRGKLEAETDADSDSFSTSLASTWSLTPTAAMMVGMDFVHLSRNALRTRHLVASGETFRDHIWPDAVQWDVGGFAELDVELSDTFRLRAGGRFDYVSSDAKAVDKTGLGGKTVRDNYAFFYGPEALDVSEGEPLGTGNVLVQWQPQEALVAHLGAGVISRAAGITERFFAFAPAPGGFQVGNPKLDPERKYEVDGGVNWHTSRLSFSVALFHYWFDDYILQTMIDQRDVNGDGIDDVIRGFRNVAARLYGGEFSAIVRPFWRLSLPLTISYVRGINTSDDTDLPEIPPLEGTVALRTDLLGKLEWWAELEGRFVAEQTKVDRNFPENDTPGFAVFHLRGGLKILKGLRIEAGIENLFDNQYSEHLTREAAVGGGDLQPGDEIPEPGRFFYAGFRYEL